MAHYEINMVGKCEETCYESVGGKKGNVMDKCQIVTGVVFEKWCNFEQMFKGDECAYTIF